MLHAKSCTSAGNAPRGRRGNGALEFALLLPWYVFLFAGAFDFGFYSYGLISTQTAARVAALYCSGSSSRATDCSSSGSVSAVKACNYALDTLRELPNVGTSVTSCTASPIVVTASNPTNVADNTSAAQVSVAYTSPKLIPIPGILAGQVTITRTVTMKVQS